MFEKRVGEKTIFLKTNRDFWSLRRYFGIIWGPKTEPRDNFLVFFERKNVAWIWESFFRRFFRKKNENSKKWKSSFRIVKYDVSWGSPCSKNQAMMWRNTSNFPSNVQQFFVKIWSKIMQKSWKTALCTNIGKESTFGAPFGRKQVIFCWFLCR